MQKPGNVLLLAIVLGAVCAAMVYRQLNDQRREIEAARGAATRPTTNVVVASSTIPIGTTIEAGAVRLVPWPTDIEPDDALTDLAVVVGKVARATIEKNQPVTQVLLVAEGEGLLPAIIAEGKRAMSVKVDDVTGVSGFITPASRVDVFVAGMPDGEGQSQRSKLVLQNVPVLATGTRIEQRENKPIEVPTVTLLVSPEEAEALALASRYEPVRLALRNYRDTTIIDTPGITARELFGQSEPAPADADDKPKRSGAEGYTVEVLLGGQSTRQVVF